MNVEELKKLTDIIKAIQDVIGHEVVVTIPGDGYDVEIEFDFEEKGEDK